MSDNEDVEATLPGPASTSGESSSQEEMTTKPLKMSFADWKKCKEALVKPESKSGGQQQQQRGNSNNNNNYSNNNSSYNNNGGGNNNNNNNGGRKQWSQNNHNNDNRGFQGSGGGGGGGCGGGPWNQNRNDYPPLSRPPPLPMQLMGMGMGFGGNFGGNFGPGPGPCGPPGPMGPRGMGPMGPMGGPMGPGGPMGGGPGPGRRNRNQRPLQPPPFWEDMMSPSHGPPPIQPPMPKCPSLWNLVPKERGPPRQNRSNQQQQPNKKFKPNNNNNRGNNNNRNSKDSKLMPPPPPPGSSEGNNNNNSQSNGGAQPSKKPKRSGTFMQVNGQWIQKPEAPLPLEDAPPGTKEERQRQWKEYRQAMKPFKNREFHNWKRTVQRLGKLPRDELDEQQLERLQKAEEYIGAHKAMLTVKHAERWVQQDKDETGQVFVRKSSNIGSWDKPKVPANGFDFKKQQNQPFFGPGRAIKGGAGGVDGSTLSQLVTQPPPPPPPLPDGQLPSDRWSSAASTTSNTGSNSNPSYYSHYSNSFVKGGTMLPSS